ncbi:MAG: hypothetical protein RJA70_1593 [Pseudomonadota bacterium]|jgi:hypothetical protein
MARLSRIQYQNTARDLLGIDASHAASLSTDERTGLFAANTTTLPTLETSQAYMRTAATLATEALKQNRQGLLPTDCMALGEAACGRAFIAALLPKAYRRPVSPQDIEPVLASFNLGVQLVGFERGLELALQTVLMSPDFLYRVERGGQDLSTAAPGTVIALDNYELASRLSYFLWQSMPDDQLFAAAADGSIATPSGRTQQVDRMMSSPAFLSMLEHFHAQWLGTEEVTQIARTADEFTNPLAAAMNQEMGLFVSDTIAEKRTVTDLFLSTNAKVSPELAALYDVQGATPGADGLASVTLPEAERAGLLTRAAFLAVHAQDARTSPTVRGYAVRDRVLCQTPPEPPKGVDAVLTPNTTGQPETVRQQLERHASDPACSGCHQLMDPVGLGFENYDLIGRYRQMDGELPVDAKGIFVGGTGPAAKEFNGGVELSKIVAQMPEAKACYARQWMSYALSRSVDEPEACLFQEFAKIADDPNRGGIRGMLQALVTHAVFSVRVLPASNK